MTGNPKSLFFDWLTAPAEKSGQQVSSSRFGSKNRNVYLFFFFFLLFGSIWILKTFSSCVNTKAMTTMTNIITGLWKNVFSSSFFYLLPQGVGTSEWKKVFFFFYLFIPERVSAHIQLMIWNISWNPTRTHIQRRPFFLTCFFFFVCVHREHIVKQGPTLSSCCVPFFLFFLYLKSKGVDIRTTTFFFSIEEFVSLFLVGWEFHFFDERRESFELQISKEKLRQTQMESISYERQFSNHPQPMRFCPRTTNAVACVFKRKKNKGGAQYFMGYRWPAISKRDTKNSFQIKILQNGLCWSLHLVGFPSLGRVCVCPFHQKWTKQKNV